MHDETPSRTNPGNGYIPRKFIVRNSITVHTVLGVRMEVGRNHILQVQDWCPCITVLDVAEPALELNARMIAAHIRYMCTLTAVLLLEYPWVPPKFRDCYWSSLQNTFSPFGLPIECWPFLHHKYFALYGALPSKGILPYLCWASNKPVQRQCPFYFQ